jgi:hypothetical protein
MGEDTELEEPAPSRSEMIKALVENVASWDLENLIAFAQDQMEAALSKASDEAVKHDYEASFGGRT